MKRCIKCNQKLPLDMFQVTKTGVRGECKPCRYKYNREWRKLYCTRTGLRNSKKIKLRDKYGLSPEQYLELLENAQHRCEICGSKESLCIDHNHKTGKVRGILCSGCNSALGRFCDNADLLARAISYVNSRGTYATKRK